jgi:hypothetical protein
MPSAVRSLSESFVGSFARVTKPTFVVEIGGVNESHKKSPRMPAMTPWRQTWNKYPKRAWSCVELR